MDYVNLVYVLLVFVTTVTSDCPPQSNIEKPNTETFQAQCSIKQQRNVNYQTRILTSYQCGFMWQRKCYKSRAVNRTRVQDYLIYKSYTGRKCKTGYRLSGTKCIPSKTTLSPTTTTTTPTQPPTTTTTTTTLPQTTTTTQPPTTTTTTTTLPPTTTTTTTTQPPTTTTTTTTLPPTTSTTTTTQPPTSTISTTTLPPTTTTTTTTLPQTTTTTQPPTTTTTTTTLPPTSTTITTKILTPSTDPLAGFCNGKADGNYKHPSRCDQFVSCVAQKFVYNCPAKLHYNAAKDQCDWPKNVICPTPAPTKKPLYCDGKKPGLYASPEGKCESYVVCTPNKIYHVKCPSPMLYDKTKKSCQAANTVNCNVSAGPASQVKDAPQLQSPQTPPNVKCNGVGGFPLTGSCTQYVSCNASGVPVIKTCPRGTNFHPKYRVCVCEDNYPCNNGKHSNFCHGKKDGNYVDPTRCDGYIACSGNLKYSMRCPGNLLYDVRQDACDNPHNVQCNTRREINFFSCHGRTGAFKSGFGCNTYFVCDGSTHTPQLKTCPKHRNFQPNTMRCVWSHSYSCEDPEFCVGKQNGKYTNRYNCYGYYECENGTTFPKNCPPLLTFDGTQCVPASQFDCHDGAVIV